MAFFATAADAGSFEPGHMFAGRYRLVHGLRSEAAGQVWRAYDVVLQAPVALAIVNAPAEQEREQVLQQIRLARQLTHPAICRVFDAGEAEGRIYCSLELVNGESLRTLVRRAGRLPSEKVADIGRQLCGGLAALHAGGLHTAIDPSVILLDLDGAVRITELGFAVTANPPAAGSPETRGARGCEDSRR
jgi:serine/threonine protein kinase